MIVDQSKVNLCEKDIEDCLYEDPTYVDIRHFGTVDRWLKRQFRVPSGIIDLLGVTEDRALVVVEIKNTAIDALALTQVSRYAMDIRNIKDYIFKQLGQTDWVVDPNVVKVVVGKSIDDRTMLEAESMDIHVITFSVRLSLFTSGTLGWNDEYTERRERAWRELSADNDMVSAVTERVALFNRDADESEDNIREEA